MDTPMGFPSETNAKRGHRTPAWRRQSTHRTLGGTDSCRLAPSEVSSAAPAVTARFDGTGRDYDVRE